MSNSNQHPDSDRLFGLGGFRKFSECLFKSGSRRI
jgi:hypothetical protein